jgi:hypothetical protein
MRRSPMARLQKAKPGEVTAGDQDRAADRRLSRVCSGELHQRLNDRPAQAVLVLGEAQRAERDLRRVACVCRTVGGSVVEGLERYRRQVRELEGLARTAARQRTALRGHVRVSRCGSRRRERRSRTTRRRSGARDGPSDQGEADGDEPSAVPTHRPLVAVAQLRHGGHAAIACHARRGSRLADLDERWTLEAAARERRATGAEQLASLWRRSEAEQAEFFRTALEQVEAREASLRAEVVA